MKNHIVKNLLLGIFLLVLKVSFSQPGSQVQLVTEPRDRAYDRVHINDLKPIPYSYLRESDVFWEKRVWTSIDFREKMNQFFLFPANSPRQVEKLYASSMGCYAKWRYYCLRCNGKL